MASGGAESWQHQVRVRLSEAAAGAWRGGAPSALREALDAHEATLVSQLDAFEAFLAEPGARDTPLGRWTVATLADPGKRAHHAMSFAVRVRGEPVYTAAEADAIEAALRPLAGSDGLLGLSRHDTNPANNLPIPRAFA